MSNRQLIVAVTTVIGLAMSTSAFAGKAEISINQIQVQPSQSMKNMTLSVSGPNRFYAQSYTVGGTPKLSFEKSGGLTDGEYRWELTGATGEKILARTNGLNNGRDKGSSEIILKSARETGKFRVVKGSILTPDDKVESKQDTSEK